MEEIQLFLDDAEASMKKSVQHTSIELSKIRAGKASPSMLEGLLVDYYGSKTPINQVASVNTPDAKTIVIKPWEKSVIPEIEKAITNSDLGLNPQNDGEVVRINVPPLTEERRITLVKQTKQEIENGRISIRNVRKDTNDSLKKLLKDGASEDAIKQAEASVQKLTDQFVKQLEDLYVRKEEEIMTI